MKLKFLATLATPFILAGCGSNIDTVKKASLEQVKSMTIGAALESWSECDKITWKDLSTDARKSVSAECEVKSEILKAEFAKKDGEYQKAVENAKAKLQEDIDQNIKFATNNFPGLTKEDVINIAKLACKYEPNGFIASANCDEELITKELESKHNIKKKNIWDTYGKYFTNTAVQINREAKPMWFGEIPKEVKKRSYIFEFVINTDGSVDIDKTKLFDDGEETAIAAGRLLNKVYKR